MLVGLWVKNYTFSILSSLKLSFSTTVFGTTQLCAIVFWADNGNNTKTVNFTYSCLHATPIKPENLLSNSLVTFNLEDANC